MTGLTVTYNTQSLIERSLTSIRRFHPELPIIIIDGSDKNNDCYKYLDSVKSPVTKVVHTDFNIGHGRGMDKGIKMIETEYALIFDSDIEMLKSPLSDMLLMMQSDTFGCGWVYEVGEDGFDYGTPGRQQLKAVPYLHPYFQLINTSNYKRFAPYCHHGAPCYKTMLDIFNRGLSKQILKHFPGLTGHTSGHGANWVGKPSEYIRHDFGGTRMANKRIGLKEIPGQWER